MSKYRGEEAMANIEFISYDGDYPNLCSGNLILSINGERFESKHCGDDEYCTLVSGGNVWFDDEWDDHVEYGPWTIDGLPKKYMYLKNEIEDVINMNVPEGCCGGCL